MAAALLRDHARWGVGPVVAVCPSDALLDEPDPWLVLHEAAPAL
ncbi:hypothetical protein [Cellulomonas cellasea]|uniref:Uncharacterized protein n=1 Tax=Cellulomonas cellasea TaxID=43670 RepID=A0A7W4YBZ0_9CELL|nr:hypothetical protein [Cellulomonas cellasea]MBB2924445.1 hypothetical protein [Cellulomonas cellasea]